jgi:hypothetical protein
MLQNGPARIWLQSSTRTPSSALGIPAAMGSSNVFSSYLVSGSGIKA